MQSEEHKFDPECECEDCDFERKQTIREKAKAIKRARAPLELGNRAHRRRMEHSYRKKMGL